MLRGVGLAAFGLLLEAFSGDTKSLLALRLSHIGRGVLGIREMGPAVPKKGRLELSCKKWGLDKGFYVFEG